MRYHHIFDPRNGYPIQNGLESVTIIGKDAVQAEALTKGIFVMGVEKGMDYIEGLDNVEAIFIVEGQKIYATSGLKDRLKIIDTSYALNYSY
ncbi:Thiamine biosynthesis lipoprotein ApbE precursor [compost metagenome]